MGDLTDSVTPSSTFHPRTLPVREDCWSEEATATLVDAWGRRYVELNRGNLRQKDWQEVADAVNAKHGHTKKTHRTDVQCKNRIDTIKKKYKTEKARVLASNGTLASSWPFFDSLDALIGSSFSAKKHQQQQASPSLSPSPPVALPVVPSYRRTTPVPLQMLEPTVTAALPQKRFSEDGYFRRHYSAVAAAAAAAAAAESESSEEEEEEQRESEEEEGEGIEKLAKAIERFGEVYERVEFQKLKQMVDLEKQRMKFANDLEIERMRIFTDTQIQIEKFRKGKRSRSNV